MLVEHGDAIGEAANISRVWREIAADQAEQGGFSGTIGAADRDALGAADRKRQRAEQAAVAMRHHHLVEGDQFAASRQVCFRQFDRERGKDLDTGPGIRQGFGAVVDHAFGDAALAGAAVFGALQFGVQKQFGLAAAGAVGAPGLVAPGLFLLGSSAPTVPRCAARRKRGRDRPRRGRARRRVARRTRTTRRRRW